jgi:hypothetical protein
MHLVNAVSLVVEKRYVVAHDDRHIAAVLDPMPRRSIRG